MDYRILQLLLSCFIICFSSISLIESSSNNTKNITLADVLKTQLYNYSKSLVNVEESKPSDKDMNDKTLTESNITDITEKEPSLQSRSDSKAHIISYDYRLNISSPNSPPYASASDIKTDSIPVYRETLSGFPTLTMFGEKSPLNVFYRRPSDINNVTKNYNNKNQILYSPPEVEHNDERDYFKPIFPTPRFRVLKFDENENESQPKNRSPFKHSIIRHNKGFHRSYFISNYNPNYMELNGEHSVLHNNRFPIWNEFSQTPSYEKMFALNPKLNPKLNNKFNSNIGEIIRQQKHQTVITKPYDIKYKKASSMMHTLSYPKSFPNSYLVTTSPSIFRDYSTHSSRDVILKNGRIYNNLKTNQKPIKLHNNRGIKFPPPMPWFSVIQQLSSEPWIADNQPIGQPSNNRVQLMHKMRPNINVVPNDRQMNIQFGRYENLSPVFKSGQKFSPQEYTLLPDQTFFKVGATLKF